MAAAGVIAGRQRWSAEKAEAAAWLRSLPEGCVDLLICSPPCERARLYLESGEDMGIARDTEAWVAWLVDVCEAMRHACKGLCVLVVEGQTRSYRYSAGPLLLAADLHRRGFHLRKPPIYRRVGIPGSGGPDWWRSDTEWCLCFTRGGPLPWSDNIATGAPPKWSPGGAMSNRMTNGQRVNAEADPWMKRGRGNNIGGRAKNGTTKKGTAHGKPRLRTKGGSPKDSCASQPAIANPGNVVEAPLTIGMLGDIMSRYVQLTKADPREVLRSLRRAVDAQAEKQWLLGIYSRVLSEEVLQPLLRQPAQGERPGDGREVPLVRQDAGAEGEAVGLFGVWSRPDGAEVLRPEVHGQSRGTGGGEASECGERRPQQGEAEEEAAPLRAVRLDVPAASPPQGQGPDEQRAVESGGPVRALPLGAPQGDPSPEDLLRLWQSGEVAGLVREALPALQEAWRPLALSLISSLEQSGRSDILDCKVGGGQLGSPLAHLNEAPYPEDLIEPFVRCFCPPDGIVADCFMGSSTTGAVAVKWGRRYIGCDLRQSQVELSHKRLSGLATLFDAPAAGRE